MSSRKKSLAKTVTWRLLGTADTVMWSYLITGSLKWAGTIGLCELTTKVLLYYLHERAWSFEWWRPNTVSGPAQFALAVHEDEDTA